MLILVALIMTFGVPLYANTKEPLNVLHLSFHKGCLSDFKTVAKELNLNLTSWWIHEDNNRFEGRPFAGGDVYNINPRRAERVWKKNKDFFDSFDVIITSDTAPLARIFLQNNWNKPLIIWVCNRFDYAAGNGKEMPFPDPAYYQLMKNALKKQNVRIISYTPYEYIYAQRKGIPFPAQTIKPIGKQPSAKIIESTVPTSIDKKNSFLIFPRLEPRNMHSAISECQKRNIPIWAGKYNGPEDLKDFKGVIFFPYAYSNIALFENIQRGVIHFVPTQRFILQLGYIWDATLRANLNWCEWYQEEYQNAFVFFDSWDDLKTKLEMTNYKQLKAKILELGKYHRDTTLAEWQKLFSDITQQVAYI